jgi:hypothetical protein
MFLLRMFLVLGGPAPSDEAAPAPRIHAAGIDKGHVNSEFVTPNLSDDVRVLLDFVPSGILDPIVKL